MIRATDRAEEGYHDSMLREHGISNKGLYGVMFMKTKDVGWKENMGFKTMTLKTLSKI